MSLAISPSSLTLESVKEKFEHWRATREKRGRIPDALWELVIPLAHQYSYTEIASALSVNHSQLKEHLQQSLSAQKAMTPFVECPLPIRAPETLISTLEFFCKNGSSVKISGMTTAEMLPVVSLLMGN